MGVEQDCFVCGGAMAEYIMFYGDGEYSVCEDDYRKYSRADIRDKRLLSAGKRLTARLAQAELSVDPSHMQRFLVEQEIDERRDEIAARLDEMDRILHGEA